MNNTEEKINGIYEKFTVTRNDGSSGPGGKHEHCRYFVLDLCHDKFAKDAILAYAAKCFKEYPVLSKELEAIAAKMEDRNEPRKS